jgi:hypothetical protein
MVELASSLADYNGFVIFVAPEACATVLFTVAHASGSEKTGRLEGEVD